MTYSHRNGESEPPTIGGFYFVRPPIVQDEEYFVVKLEYDEDEYPPAWKIWHVGSEVDYYVKNLSKHNQWWGPIVPPWEQPAPPDVVADEAALLRLAGFNLDTSEANA